MPTLEKSLIYSFLIQSEKPSQFAFLPAARDLNENILQGFLHRADAQHPNLGVNQFGDRGIDPRPGRKGDLQALSSV